MDRVEAIAQWFLALGLVVPTSSELEAMAQYAARLPLTVNTPQGEQTKDFR